MLQHNDGINDAITGTEKDHVVQDYAKMMQTGIQGSQTIIQQCAHFLLHPDQVIPLFFLYKLTRLSFEKC